jgi:DNA-binding NtrC family response regulator
MPNRSPTPPARILVADDEALIRETLAEYLQQEGFAVNACGSGEAALDLASEHRFDVALCDVQLPGIDGIETLVRLLKVSPQTFVVLITAFATVENAVEAFQCGAHDYLMKPILLDEVLGKVRRMLRYRDLYRENQDLRRELNRQYDPEQIVGRGPAMRQVFDLVGKVAPTRSTVLITGESGTGKELIARAIHRLGLDPEARFLAVNCAAIPHDLLESQLFGRRKGAFTGADRDQAGVFDHAGSGTVFLDEISELSPATQAKLLRAIDQKEILPVGANEPICIDARVLAATNKDLREEVEAGRFREDVYYRLNVVTIPLPPLRERRDDIPDLVEFLLAKHAREMGKRMNGVTHEAMRLLRSGPWRGNVRELDNALQRAVILGEGPFLTPADLPPDLAPAKGDPSAVDELDQAVDRFKRLHVERVLRQTPEKREAAKRLNIGLSSLYRLIAELGIDVNGEW